MVADADMTTRLRDAVGAVPGVVEKRIFGGVCILLNGHMIGAASRDRTTGRGRFIFRVGRDNAEKADALAGGEPMVHGGRKLGGVYHLDEEEATDAMLADWAALALSHVATLPPKQGG